MCGKKKSVVLLRRHRASRLRVVRLTGELYWTYDTYAAIWGSPYVADGKVYIGDEDGDLAVLKTGKEMELLYEINMGSAVYTSPVAKNGVLYVTNRSTLFALEQKK